MKNLLLLLLLISSVTLNFSFGQRNKSEAERKQFINEITRQINPSGDKEAIDYINKKLYSQLIEGSKFSEERFNQMSKTVDVLLEKRHRPYPHLYNYILGFSSLIEKNKSTEEFNTWHAIVDELMENRNPRRVEDFLQTTGNFFYKGMIAEAPNYQWYCLGEQYKLVNDKTIQLIFDQTTIICKTINKSRNSEKIPFSDSLKIENTKGIVDFTKNQFRGSGGLFTWEKVGLARKDTKAELKSFGVSFKSTNLIADSVILTTPYVDEPILGKLIDRAAKGSVNESKDSEFPQFTSYQADFKIKNLAPDVNYQGGFSLEGNEFVGIGNKENRAKLTYLKDNKTFIISYSSQVRLKDRVIKTPMAQFTLFLNTKDSIYHPGLNITYNLQSKNISFVRGSAAITQAPFIDSYHQLNIYVEELNYQMDASHLYLAFNKNTAEQQRIARFESFNYYDEQLFQKIQGMSSINPLSALFNYAWKYDKFMMDEGSAASALNLTLVQAKPKLLELSTQGFINYDTERGMVTVNKKTENFVKAKSGKIDYDNIAFFSNLAPTRTDLGQKTEDDPKIIERITRRNKQRAVIQEYGTIDLETLKMELKAVDFIPISDGSRTVIYPEYEEVTIQENRDIVFSGWVNSGKWEIKVENSDYLYASNKFNIHESEMAYFNVNPMQKADGSRIIPLQSSITGIQGELLVNDVSNRSGLKKDFGNYPILISKEKTKVFYDNKPLYNGVYDRDRFYFEVEPFQVDSLLTFDETFIRFSGTLVSAGIFPKLQDQLKVMPDYALGFSKDAPTDGYQFYGPNGTYNNKILLSNSGLQGSGSIDFLNSTVASKNLFTFLPDSTIGSATFLGRPVGSGVEFPDAVGEDTYITFVPKSKILSIKSLNEKIKFFEEDAELNGTAYITEKGMRGKGSFHLSGAIMQSTNFIYDRWTAEADTSSFALTNKYKKEGDLDEDPLALKTENVKGSLDFKERKGMFVSNEGESIVEFPANEYICIIDQFTWFMDKDEMILERADDTQSEDITIEGDLNMAIPNFFSINTKQDSLQFKSPKAKFSLKERRIYAYGVEWLDVADARIYPDSSTLVIHRKARMEDLDSATIVINSVTQYHTIKNANITIKARRDYAATGDYEYGKGNDEKQYIHLDRIFLDNSLQTLAEGTVKSAENFKLSKHFNFYGDIALNADNPFLNFKGATKVDHDCNKFEKNWMSFEARIDPENIQIPIAEDMVDLEGNPIAVGIRWRKAREMDNVSLYPTFLSSLDNEIDSPVITASGYLQYDTTAFEYQISSKEKLINRKETGNFISLNTQTCSLDGDGAISLGMDFGTVETASIGTIHYNQETDQVDMDLTLAIRMPVDERVFGKVGAKIEKDYTLKPVDFTSTTLEQAITEWVGQKAADKIKSDYTLKQEFKSVPKALSDAIVLSGLKLTSHTVMGDEQRGLKSATYEAVLVNIFKEPVMKTIPVKFFAQERVVMGGKFNLLLDVPGLHEYFIDYDYRKEGVMSILSNDLDFNDDIAKMKPNDKKAKNFIYDITDKSAYKRPFLRIFN